MFPSIRLDLSKRRLRPSIVEWLHATTHLQYLHTLHITSSPYPESDEAQLIPLHHYDYLLREIARRIFKLSASYSTKIQVRSKLRVLAIGAYNVDLPDGRKLVEGSVKRMLYLRGNQTDIFGRTSVTALSFESGVVNYVAPASDILDFLFV
ncbi:MAG: hypothetical protein M1835_000575 [Candelina submexicana]|nr:MAG: hypothetical protein M1835_000575 [Candelina submexicana]